MQHEHTERGPGIRLIGYVVLLVATLIGMWAIGLRFAKGLMATNLTQHVPWGLWISLYIYFIGLSVGAFLLASVIVIFDLKRYKPLLPLALIQALICMLLGLFLVWLDLGHPARFFNLFIHFNPTSILAWESCFYTLYVLIIMLMLYLVLKPMLASDSTRAARAERWLRTLAIIGVVVAMFVRGGTGAVFAVVKSRPTWYTGLLPIVFLVSAATSGIALLAFLTATVMPIQRDAKLALLQSLIRITVGLVILGFLLHCSEALVAFYGGIPTHVAAWKLMLFGPYRWVFWLGQIGLGVLVPILIFGSRRAFNSVVWLGTVGILVVIGALAGWINAVIPPLLSPQFPLLPEAYQHFRNAVGYFPSINECLVGLGVVAIGIWAFLFFLKVIPLYAAMHELVPKGGASS